ncbi:methyltransferase domain-containing protein, partial [archaeon]
YYELRHGELPAGVRLAARELHCDAETDVFLESCDTSFCSSFAAYFLRFFFSVTDTNAILRRGQMFVLSSAQLRDVLAPVLAPASVDVEAGHAGGVGRNIPATVGTDGAHIPGLRLLDVGAGDGGVTARLAKYFDHVTVTEVSAPMVRRLRERGYAAHHTAVISSDIFPTAGLFDVVSIFNVLDRCDNPRDLLADAIRLLKPGTGRLLMAVVLPFSEFVEDGTERRAPHGMLPMRGARCGDGASFEHSLSALLMRVFLPMGLCVERIAKVPYLCRGDMRRPYYVLADAILVFRYSPAEAEAQRTASLAHAVNEQGGRVPAAPVMPPTLGALGSAPTLASAAASSRAKAAAASAALARPLDTASLLRELPDD